MAVMLRRDDRLDYWFVEIRLFLRGAGVCAILCLLTLWTPAFAAQAPLGKQHLDITSQSAEESVKVLAREFDRSILFQTDQVQAIRSNRVRGRLTLREALDEMFEGTELYGGLTENGVIIVSLRETNISEGRQPMKKSGLFLTTAVSAAFAAITSPFSAHAQTEEGAQNEDVVIVTGSRIGRAGFDTLQPAVQIDSDFVDERGFTNVIQALNETPGFNQGTTSTGGQAAATLGQNFANAFGLGSQRTLTLINGRRVVSGASAQNGAAGFQDPLGGNGLQVDLNIIPTGLIDRIETIYTGGAPIYGQDAIAGTVNIILKDDYEGAEFDAQYGITDQGDGDTFRFRTLVGGNFADGRGNAVLTAEYVNISKIDAIDRETTANDPSFCSTANPEVLTFLGRSFDGPTPTSVLCPDGINVWAVSNTGTPLPFNNFASFNGGAAANNFQNAAGEPLTFALDGNSLITFDEANFGVQESLFFSVGADGENNPFITKLSETNTLIAPLDRWVVSGVSHYDLTDNVRFISEVLFARSEARNAANQPQWSNFAFSPGTTGNLAIRLDNPYVTDQVRDTILADAAARSLDLNIIDSDGDGTPDTDGFLLTRSNIDIFAGSENFRDQDTLRIVSGFEGEFGFFDRAWNWETTFNFGQSNSETRTAAINGERFALALDATRDVNGNIVCRATIDPPDVLGGSSQADPKQRDAVNNCVPINPLGLGNFDEAAREFLVSQRFSAAQNQQMVVEANLGGDIFDLPGGAVAIAGGFQHRREKAEFSTDQANEDNFPGLIGVPAGGIEGKFHTNEIYGETVIPVLGEDFTLPGISSFVAEGAIRFVDNSVAGQDVTWVAGGRLGLNLPGFGEDGVTLRGNFTQAIRAPSITELFLPRSGVVLRAQDPCDFRNVDNGPNPALRLANCQAAAAASGFAYDPDTFLSVIVNASQPGTAGGNLNLTNEVSDSWTVGTVLVPDFIPGLRLSVDWTSITLNDAIINIGGTELLQTCFDDVNFPAAPECTAFTRNPTTFQITNVDTGLRNAATLEYQGLVSNLVYSFDAADLGFLGNAPGRFDLIGNFNYTDKLEQSGLARFDGTKSFEHLRMQLNLRYSTDRYSLLWQTRHIGKSVIDVNFDPATPSNDGNVLKAHRIHNATFQYNFTNNVSARIVVNNIFDNVDSFRATAVGRRNSNANIFTDPIGRRFVFGLTASF